MQLLLLLFRANGRRLVLAMIVSVLSGASSAGLIALVHYVWQHEPQPASVWGAGFLATLVVLVSSAACAQLMVLDLSLKAVSDLRIELTSRILSTPLRRLEELGSPRLLAVLTDDVNMLAAVLPNTPRLVIDITTLVAGGLYMAWLSWVAFAVVTALLAVGIASYRLFWSKAVGYIWQARRVYDELFQSFRALHDGIKQLKLNRARRQLYLARDLSHSVDSYRRLQFTGRSLLVGAESITRVVFFAVLGVLVFAIPQLAGVQADVLSGYVLMALYLYRPLGLILELIPEFGRARVAWQKIESLELSLERTSAAFPTDQRKKTASWQRLDLSEATYSYRREYDDNVFTMGPIDVTFCPGELVFVTGGNGSGKTTFAKTLTSLYPLDKGEIRLDGELVTSDNRERFRELFSAVFTDYHLFSDLVGSESGDLDAQATAYLHELQLDHKVTVVGGRLSTTQLSQGQRKRLALLAAYLEDRPFYVFDEWAADQDPQFKHIFYNQVLLDLKHRGKTVVVITHDVRYLHLADRCLRLEEGRLHHDVDATAGLAESDDRPLG